VCRSSARRALSFEQPAPDTDAAAGPVALEVAEVPEGPVKRNDVAASLDGHTDAKPHEGNSE
jgi:hypothetical protein